VSRRPEMRHEECPCCHEWELLTDEQVQVTHGDRGNGAAVCADCGACDPGIFGEDGCQRQEIETKQPEGYPLSRGD
jgi:hypothetical protein